jgi:hypothetical protein
MAAGETVAPLRFPTGVRIVPFFGFIFASALIVLSLTAGCAQVAWDKPGSDAVAVGNDLEDCRREARLHASRLGLHRTSPVPNVAVDPRRPETAVQIPSTLPSRDAVVEQDWTARCMRQKGYSLIRLH